MSSNRRRFGSVRRLPSGRWQVRYRDKAGKQHAAPSTFEHKTDAAMWLARVETDLHRGEWINPERGRVSFGEWADDWLAAKIWVFLPLSFLFTFTQLPMLLRHGLSVEGEEEETGNPPPTG